MPFKFSSATYVVECDQLFRPASIVAANGMEDAVPDEGGEELFNEEDQKGAAD